MRINIQFLAGILFMTSVFSWAKLFYWHFDDGIMFAFFPAMICLVLSVIIMAD